MAIHTQKINILFVITKLELGGAQKQLLSLIRNLDKGKFRPFLFTAKEGLLLGQASLINGLTIKKSRSLERPINPIKDILALIEILRYIRKNNIQIVHTHSSKAGILGRLAARACAAETILHTVHGWSFNDYQPYLYRRLFIILERICARFTDRLIVVSKSDKEKGLMNGIGDNCKYTLIRYGIDYAEFGENGEDIKRELGAGPQDLIVGTISCFKPQKSPLDFIRLACLVSRSFSNVKFILVGDGILRKKIEMQIAKYGLEKRVILSGWRQDIPRILSAMDVFALTSLWEGLPISVLEAMSASRPVVATDTGGVTEVLIDGKTGFIVSRGDMETMSERVALLLKDEPFRRQMAQNAKNFLNSDFTTENMVKSNQDLYKDLITANKGRAN